LIGAGLGAAKTGVAKDARKANDKNATNPQSAWVNSLKAAAVGRLTAPWMRVDTNEYALIDWTKIVRVDFTPNRDSATLMVIEGARLRSLTVVNYPQTLRDLQQALTAPDSTWVPVIVNTGQPGEDAGGLYVDLTKVVNVGIVQPIDNGGKDTPVLSFAGSGALRIHAGSVYDQIAATKVYRMIDRPQPNS